MLFLITISGNLGKRRLDLASLLVIQGTFQSIFADLEEECVLLRYPPFIFIMFLLKIYIQKTQTYKGIT